MQEAEQPKNILQMLVLYTSSKNVAPDDNVRIICLMKDIHCTREIQYIYGRGKIQYMLSKELHTVTLNLHSK